MLGRTLLQHGAVTTFGALCAGRLVALDDAIKGIARVLRDRLAVSRTATRALLSSATVLVLVAALLAFAATRARPQHAVRQVTDSTVPTAQSVDAAGCPVGSIGPTRARALRRLRRMFEEGSASLD
jgi:hypothetical protein